MSEILVNVGYGFEKVGIVMSTSMSTMHRSLRVGNPSAALAAASVAACVGEEQRQGCGRLQPW